MAENKTKKTLVNRGFIGLTKTLTRKEIIISLCVQKAIQHKKYIDTVNIKGEQYLIFDLTRQELTAINPKYFNTKTKLKNTFEVLSGAFIYNIFTDQIAINIKYYNLYLLTLTSDVINKKKYEWLKNKEKLTKEEIKAFKEYKKLDYFRIDLETLTKSKAGSGVLGLYLMIASRDTGLHEKFKIKAETTAKQRQQFNNSFDDYNIKKIRGSDEFLVQKRSGNNDTK